MPIHQFESESGDTIDVYVPASAPSTEHSKQTRDGKVYKRVYSAPLAAADLSTRHGDATIDDYRRCTSNKRGLKAKDGWEISAEMSAKRAQRDGCDPVKEASYARYEKENDEKHPDVTARERLARAGKRLSEWGIKLNGV